MDADPTLERSMQIRRNVNKTLYVNQHIHKDLRKEKTLQSFFLWPYNPFCWALVSLSVS
jgi:hypothetical protein